MQGLGFRIEEASARALDLACDLDIRGVDSNLARVAASRYFRAKQIPVKWLFTSLRLPVLAPTGCGLTRSPLGTFDHGLVRDGIDGCCLLRQAVEELPSIPLLGSTGPYPTHAGEAVTFESAPRAARWPTFPDRESRAAFSCPRPSLCAGFLRRIRSGQTGKNRPVE